MQDRLLEEETLNAIEEWQDILPEANLKTQIGIISNLKQDQRSLIGQINTMREELDKTHETKEAEKGKLSERLKTKEDELQKIRRELREKEAQIGFSPASVSIGSIDPSISSYTIPSRSVFFDSTSYEICPGCGNGVSAGDKILGKCKACGAQLPA